MSIRRWMIVGLVWVISLVAIDAVASAQAQLWRPVPRPTVLFGEDVGFRVEGFRGEVPTGRIVIRVNGEWIEATVGALTPKLLR